MGVVDFSISEVVCFQTVNCLRYRCGHFQAFSEMVMTTILFLDRFVDKKFYSLTNLKKYLCNDFIFPTLLSTTLVLCLRMRVSKSNISTVPSSLAISYPANVRITVPVRPTPALEVTKLN
jgi:hypothetical protein